MFRRLLHILPLLILASCLPGEIHSQDAVVDTSAESSDSYFTDLSDLVAIRLFTVTKWNALDIIKDDVPLKLRPNSPTSLGASFNYRSFGISLGFGLPKSQESYDKYGRTRRLDLQANIYGKKIGIDAFGQLYKSYYNYNPEEFLEWTSDTFPVIADMRVMSIGLNGFYIFNSDKFSYKAAFVRNQIQLRSAGSFLLGAFSHLDLARTDNGFIPGELPDSLRSNFDLKAFNTFSFGLTAGYMYTWVISKHFFLNGNAIPGFGFQRINLTTISGDQSSKTAPAAQLSVRGTLGYESKHFYAGITGSVIWRNFKYQGYEVDLSTEQMRIFVGKRF